MAGARGETIERRQGSGFALPCRAQGFPVPEFRSVPTFIAEGPALAMAEDGPNMLLIGDGDSP